MSLGSEISWPWGSLAICCRLSVELLVADFPEMSRFLARTLRTHSLDRVRSVGWESASVVSSVVSGAVSDSDFQEYGGVTSVSGPAQAGKDKVNQGRVESKAKVSRVEAWCRFIILTSLEFSYHSLVPGILKMILNIQKPFAFSS